MLSSIQGVLNEIYEISNKRYSQGGLIYSYSYFHHTAHSNLDKALVNKTNLTGKELDVSEIKLLAELIERSVNDHNAETISPQANFFTSALVAGIHDSLHGYFTKIVSYDDNDSSQQITIESINCCNVGHKLTLFWSLD